MNTTPPHSFVASRRASGVLSGAWVRRLTWLWLLAMSALHTWQAASVSDNFSTTFDEVVHLTAGTLYWRERDYRFQPENGLLPQLWAALPVARRTDLKFPDPASPESLGGDTWRLGDKFFHHSGNDLASMLRQGRWMIALLGGLLVLAVSRWAWTLAGAAAAAGTATLAAFSPTLLAHAGLITSDTAAALGFVAVVAAWWRLLHAVTPARVLLAGCATAYLALAKFSVVLTPFIVALLLAARLLRATPLPVRCGRWRWRVRGARRVAAFVPAAVTGAVLCWALIWTAYGYRYEARGPRAGASASFFESWPIILIEKPAVMLAHTSYGEVQGRPARLQSGAVQRAVRWATANRVLPEAWLFGLAYVDRNSRYRLAYFDGEWEGTGWLRFFPTAYLMKSTWPELLLHTGAVGLLLAACWSARLRRLAYRLTPLLALIAVYGVFSLTSSLNIGHRHILPLYAAGAVLGGVVLAELGRRARLWRVLGGVLLIGQIATAVVARPDYLAYFNQLAGGTAGAHRYFVDSSLDWGQDLPRLAGWQRTKRDALPVTLSYFGMGAPAYYGIDAVRTGDSLVFETERPLYPELQPGWFVLSATMLQRVNTLVRGPWNEKYEEHYRAMRNWWATLLSLPRDRAMFGPDGGEINAQQARHLLTTLDQLRFGRLCHFLQDRTPDARIGASLLAFRLSEAELRQMLDGPLNPPLRPAAATGK